MASMALQEQHSNAAGECPAAMELDSSVEVLRSRDGFELHEVGDGAVDVRGRPCIKSKTGNWRASALIFGKLIAMC